MATTNAMFTITDTGDLSGRNLLQRSFFTKEPWTGPTYNAVGDGFGMYHDKYCLPVNLTYLHRNTNKGANSIFPDLEFQEGVQYTISGNWAQFRSDTNYNKMYLRMHHTDGTNATAVQPNQNNVWTSFKLTSTAGKTVDKITMTYSNSGYFPTYIENFKLEVGAAATDWTPAPEDVVTAMETANTAKATAESKNSVYYQTSAPTGKKVGDTWFDTDDGNKIYRWNGSAWVAAELGDSAVANLSASKLIAGSVMGNVILGGTIQAGGSDVGQDGKVLVKDANNTEVASLSKDGLIATAGSVGGWDISTEGLVRTEVVSENVTRTSKFGCWNDSMINGGCELRLLQEDPLDDSHVYSDARIAYGVGNSDGYIDIYDDVYDTYETANNISQTHITANDIIIAQRTVSHINHQVLSSAQTTYGVYGPEVDGVGNIAHWSVLSPERALKDNLKVTVYHCGNLFYISFYGKIPAGLSGSQDIWLPIVDGDDENRTQSQKCAPPRDMNVYLQPQTPSTARLLIKITTGGRIILGYVLRSSDGSSNITVVDNVEERGVFWAHIG